MSGVVQFPMTPSQHQQMLRCYGTLLAALVLVLVSVLRVLVLVLVLAEQKRSPHSPHSPPAVKPGE
jgi:hypothetical protein